MQKVYKTSLYPASYRFDLTLRVFGSNPLKWSLSSLMCLFLGFIPFSQAQVYYALSDGQAAQQNDAIRRVGLNGSGDTQIITSFLNTPGVLAYDAQNNQLFVAETRPSNPAIYKINLNATPATVSTFLTFPTTTVTNIPTGLAVDALNGYLYYTITDNTAATTADQLRRIRLNGTGDELIATNFAEIIGTIALDLANNRVFVTDTRITAGDSQIFAVNLTTKVAAQFVSNPLTIRGVAVDKVNSTLYYVLDDADASGTTDALRKIGLNGTGDALVATGFVNQPGSLVVDPANNRVLVADTRASSPKISAVAISNNATSTFLTPPGSGVTLTGIALVEANPLPVRLASFRAEQLATGSVSLAWQTSWEQNSAWFDIQRSDNAKEFGTIDRVEAKGEATQQQQYSFLDVQQPTQTVYYRLRMVDRDGSFAYSPIVAVAVDSRALRLTLLGNPVQNTVRAMVNSPQSQVLHIDLQTLTGQQINHQAVSVNQGQTTLELNVEQVQAGLYQLIVSDGSSKRTQRILIH